MRRSRDRSIVIFVALRCFDYIFPVLTKNIIPDNTIPASKRKSKNTPYVSAESIIIKFFGLIIGSLTSIRSKIS